jgi:glutamyl-tRNA synthetase
MHIGGLRTALYDWFLARKSGGQFILRIEDTDRNRYDPDAERHIKESLDWLGLDLDEGPGIGGPYAPYTQSERLELYSDAAAKLIETGDAYYDDTQPEELAALRQRQQAAGQAPGYDNRGRYRTSQQIQESRDKGLDVVVRFKVPDHGEIQVEDEVRGRLRFDLSLLQDFVILKSDGFPTYHLAHVVDDYDMGITHVIRGEEWISSLPRHVLIQRALNIPMPKYVHVPLITARDGAKLSKRHGAQSALEYRDAGYTPDAVLNYLALLGWSPGDDREVMNRGEIASRFEIARILSHPAKFSAQKLEWMNQQHIMQADEDALAEMMMPYLERSEEDGGLPDVVDRPVDRAIVSAMVPVLRERIKVLPDVVELIDFLFVDEVHPNAAEMIGRRMNSEMVLTALHASVEALSTVDPFTSEEIEKMLRAQTVTTGLKAGQLFTPIRIAVTAKRIAPPLFESIEVLGKDRTLERLRNGLALFERHVETSSA